MTMTMKMADMMTYKTTDPKNYTGNIQGEYPARVSEAMPEFCGDHAIPRSGIMHGGIAFIRQVTA